MHREYNMVFICLDTKSQTDRAWTQTLTSEECAPSTTEGQRSRSLLPLAGDCFGFALTSLAKCFHLVSYKMHLCFSFSIKMHSHYFGLRKVLRQKSRKIKVHVTDTAAQVSAAGIRVENDCTLLQTWSVSSGAPRPSSRPGGAAFRRWLFS